VKGRYGKSGWFPSNLVVKVEEYQDFLENAAKVRGFENALRSIGRLSETNKPQTPKTTTKLNDLNLDIRSFSRSQSLPLVTGTTIRRRKDCLPSFHCNTTGNQFIEPVVNIDGQTLEQITFTNLYGKDTIVLPNHTLKSAIEEYRQREDEKLPIIKITPLMKEMENHNNDILKLKEKKKLLLKKLNNIKKNNKTLSQNCDVFNEISIQQSQFRQLYNTNQGDDHWLLILCRQLSHLHMKIPSEGNELSYAIEDTLDELIDISLKKQLKNINIWSSSSNIKTKEEEYESHSRRRKSMFGSIFNFSSTTNN